MDAWTSSLNFKPKLQYPLIDGILKLSIVFVHSGVFWKEKLKNLAFVSIQTISSECCNWRIFKDLEEKNRNEKCKS